MEYYNQYEIDKVWKDFKDLIKNGFIDNKDVDDKWKSMAKQSSQKRLMLQKQQSLKTMGGLI